MKDYVNIELPAYKPTETMLRAVNLIITASGNTAKFLSLRVVYAQTLSEAQNTFQDWKFIPTYKLVAYNMAAREWVETKILAHVTFDTEAIKKEVGL